MFIFPIPRPFVQVATCLICGQWVFNTQFVMLQLPLWQLEHDQPGRNKTLTDALGNLVLKELSARLPKVDAALLCLTRDLYSEVPGLTKHWCIPLRILSRNQQQSSCSKQKTLTGGQGNLTVIHDKTKEMCASMLLLVIIFEKDTSSLMRNHIHLIIGHLPMFYYPLKAFHIFYIAKVHLPSHNILLN